MTNQLRSPLRSSLRSPFEHRRGGWSPLALFSSGEQGFIYDLSDMSTLFQDSAGTTPVTGPNQPVGLMLDKSGRGNHAVQPTAGKRPMLKTDGVNWYIKGDGIDDFMYTGNIDFTGTDKMTVWLGARKVSGVSMIMEINTAAPYITTNEIPDSWCTRAGNNTGFFCDPYGNPSTNIITLNGDLSETDSATAAASYIDGVLNTDNPASYTPMTVNYGNYPLYLLSRAGTQLFFSGNLYSLMIRGAASSADELSKTNTYIASKTGVTL